MYSADPYIQNISNANIWRQRIILHKVVKESFSHSPRAFATQVDRKQAKMKIRNLFYTSNKINFKTRTIILLETQSIFFWVFEITSTLR